MPKKIASVARAHVEQGDLEAGLPNVGGACGGLAKAP